jgi:hypothetical protein
MCGATIPFKEERMVSTSVYDKYDVAMAKQMHDDSVDMCKRTASLLADMFWIHPSSPSNQAMELKSLMTYIVGCINGSISYPHDMYYDSVIGAHHDEMLKTSVQRKKNTYIISILKELNDYINETDIDDKLSVITSTEEQFDHIIADVMRQETESTTSQIMTDLRRKSYLSTSVDDENDYHELGAIMQYIVDNLSCEGDQFTLPENMYCEEVVSGGSEDLVKVVKRCKDKYIELVMNKITRNVGG